MRFRGAGWRVRAARAGALGQEVPGRGGRGTALITRSNTVHSRHCLPTPRATNSAHAPCAFCRNCRNCRNCPAYTRTPATDRRGHLWRVGGTRAHTTNRTTLTRTPDPPPRDRPRGPAAPRAPGRPVGITPGASASPSALYIGQHVTHGTLNQATLLRFRLNRRGNQRPQSPRSLCALGDTLDTGTEQTLS